eukprot:COSAG02_NODE_2513_length_8624_cov_15.389443_5_plen_54_part_00
MPCQPYLSEGCRLFILNGRDYWHYSTLVAAGETDCGVKGLPQRSILHEEPASV